MLNLPKEHISISQVNAYQRCPMQYWFIYIENKRIPPAVALVEGGSHHRALEMNNSQKIESCEDLPAKTVIEKFTDTFSDECKEVENWEDETKDNVIDRGKALIGKYMSEVARTIQPVRVEQEFNLPLNFDGEMVNVLGYIDLEQKDILSDYKVVGRTKSQSDVDNDLQLSVYGCVTNQKKAENICLVKTKQPKIERVSTSLTPGRAEWAAYVMSEVIKAISAGVFPPTKPDNYLCSSRFCGFYCLCRGK